MVRLVAIDMLLRWSKEVFCIVLGLIVNSKNKYTLSTPGRYGFLTAPDAECISNYRIYYNFVAFIRSDEPISYIELTLKKIVQTLVNYGKV